MDQTGALIREATSAPASPYQWPDIYDYAGTFNFEQKEVTLGKPIDYIKKSVLFLSPECTTN